MDLLQMLSPYLRGVVTMQCYGPYLANIPFLMLDSSGLSAVDQRAALYETRLFTQQVGNLTSCCS